MRNSLRTHLTAAAGLAIVLGAQTGCQTQIAGMTLPSPHYLQHPPQYFPKDPDFPLTKELATQQEQAGLLKPRDVSAPVSPIPGAAGPAAPVPAPPAGADAPPVPKAGM